MQRITEVLFGKFLLWSNRLLFIWFGGHRQPLLLSTLAGEIGHAGPSKKGVSICFWFASVVYPSRRLLSTPWQGTHPNSRRKVSKHICLGTILI